MKDTPANTPAPSNAAPSNATSSDVTAVTNAKPSCWVVTEGMAGTENQCLGICDALGITPDIKRIALRQPWRSFSPALRILPSLALSGKSDRLDAPYPDLVLASGRKSVIAALHIQRASHGKTMIVMVQDPAIAPHYFDMVVVPYHDPLRGPNVLVTEGAPNRVTPERLRQSRDLYHHRIDHLPPHRVAVLIGGDSKRHAMTEDAVTTLANGLKKMQSAHRAGLMVTVSRRTPPKYAQVLKDALMNTDTFFWDGTGENPYFSFLHHADVIMVTEDSVSMLSEAATTGKPVYRLPMAGDAGKLARFYAYMEEIHAIRPFDGGLDHWTYRAPNDALMVATIIQKELESRR